MTSGCSGKEILWLDYFLSVLVVCAMLARHRSRTGASTTRMRQHCDGYELDGSCRTRGVEDNRAWRLLRRLPLTDSVAECSALDWSRPRRKLNAGSCHRTASVLPFASQYGRIHSVTHRDFQHSQDLLGFGIKYLQLDLLLIVLHFN
jgi:hypothetical protein